MRSNPLLHSCAVALLLGGCIGADSEDRALTREPNYVSGVPGGDTAGGASGGAGAATTAGTGSTAGTGGTAGGGTAGTGTTGATGSTAGGNTAGGSTAGGSTAGGSTAGTGGAGGTNLPADCATPWLETGTYHPAGFDASETHGLEAKLQRDTCQNCHGAQLNGCTQAPSCDNCHDGGHPEGWRSDCTYCHGGQDSDTGAPPRDIDGATALNLLSFRAHTQHAQQNDHPAYDCTQCHTKPEDVLSKGHMFDETPGAAEVTFSMGLSKQGAYDGNGGCSNLYCHGDGEQNGRASHTDAKPGCGDCHGNGRGQGLSGEHDEHLGDGIACSDCHKPVVTTSNAIAFDDGHVNGKVELKMDTSWDGTRCSGSCHGENHFLSTW